MKLSLKIVALVVALSPAVAMAQSANPDPAVPGSGYKIPETARTNPEPLSAAPVDLSKPGDGYTMVPAPRTNPTNSLSGDDQDLSKPGDGYRILPPAQPAAAK